MYLLNKISEFTFFSNGFLSIETFFEWQNNLPVHGSPEGFVRETKMAKVRVDIFEIFEVSGLWKCKEINILTRDLWVPTKARQPTRPNLVVFPAWPWSALKDPSSKHLFLYIFIILRLQIFQKYQPLFWPFLFPFQNLQVSRDSYIKLYNAKCW